jgi:CRP-like cAMP-binding protein
LEAQAVAIDTMAAVLAEQPFFKDVEPRHLRAVAGCAANVRFDPGEFLFRDGDPADKAYLLTQGQVFLELSVPGKGTVIVDTLEERALVGWSWLFPPYRAHLDARAVNDVRAVSLDGVCLRSKCDDDAALGYEMMKRFAAVFVGRLEVMRRVLLDVAARRPQK